MRTAKPAYYQNTDWRVPTLFLFGRPSPHIIRKLTDVSLHYSYADCQVCILLKYWLTSSHIISIRTAKSTYYQKANWCFFTLLVCELPSPHIIKILTDKFPHYFYSDGQVHILSIYWPTSPPHYSYADCQVSTISICWLLNQHFDNKLTATDSRESETGLLPIRFLCLTFPS